MSANETNNEVRYEVAVKADEAFGYNGVTFYLFHNDGLPEEVYARMIPAHLNRHGLDHRGVADMTFSRGEVSALAQYFGRRPGGWLLTSEEAKAVLGEYDHLAVADNTGVAEFWQDEDYNLTFKVAGYYDLRDSEGPTKAARRARLLAQLAELDNE
jgi:hypothetical protein